mgnify:CR=1 FL=1
MTESVLDVDSVTDGGTPDAGAAETTTSTDNEVTLFSDATLDSAPDATNGHSADASEVPDNVDLLRTPADELPADPPAAMGRSSPAKRLSADRSGAGNAPESDG